MDGTCGWHSIEELGYPRTLARHYSWPVWILLASRNLSDGAGKDALVAQLQAPKRARRRQIVHNSHRRAVGRQLDGSPFYVFNVQADDPR